jgi:hypothetical protein
MEALKSSCSPPGSIDAELFRLSGNLSVCLEQATLLVDILTHNDNPTLLRQAVLLTSRLQDRLRVVVSQVSSLGCSRATRGPSTITRVIDACHSILRLIQQRVAPDADQLEFEAETTMGLDCRKWWWAVCVRAKSILSPLDLEGIGEAVAEEIEELRDQLTIQKVTDSGPVEPNQFAWPGREPATLTRLQWELANHLWKRTPKVGDGVRIEELKDHVWGDEGMRDKTVCQAVSDLKRALQEANIPVSWGAKRPHIIRRT